MIGKNVFILELRAEDENARSAGGTPAAEGRTAASPQIYSHLQLQWSLARSPLSAFCFYPQNSISDGIFLSRLEIQSEESRWATVNRRAKSSSASDRHLATTGKTV
jgi:hypothetical protein